MKSYFTYILTNKKRNVLYVGITNNLLKRVWEHKKREVPGFTRKYNVDCLIYYEECSDVNAAIAREKRIKNWKRQWKIDLINGFNTKWEDLHFHLLQGIDPDFHQDDR
ncbi:MAG: GIY-YIG nuclease family protein [Candidatus Moranbacteria bacterium]|nr:GIY-YIG nuclease family protein [Candidatus Moranbacteria bacterium]